MTRLSRLRRESAAAFFRCILAGIVAPHAAGADWLLFAVHPVLAILSGLRAAVAVLVGVAAGREASRLYAHIEREELEKLRLPRP